MKTEKDLLHTFSDANTTMRPQFKKQLRSQITGKQQRRSWVAPRLVWAPIAVLIVLGLSIIAGTQDASAPHQNPFTPKTVSAEELIDKSDRAITAQRDTQKYNFWIDTSTMKPGPRKATCTLPGLSDVYVPDYRFTDYTYINKAANVEAYYAHEHRDNADYVMQEVYNDAGADVLKDVRLPQPQSLSSWLQRTTADGKDADIQTNDIYVMQNGKLQQNDAIRQTKQNGTSVYEFYTVPIKHDGPQSGCDPQITRYVIDANTYQILEIDTYLDSVAPENVTEQSTWSYEAANVPVDVAIEKMTAAGYNKSLATDHLTDKHIRPLSR